MDGRSRQGLMLNCSPNEACITIYIQWHRKHWLMQDNRTSPPFPTRSATTCSIGGWALERAFRLGINFFDFADIYASNEVTLQIQEFLQHTSRQSLVTSLQTLPTDKQAQKVKERCIC